MTSSLGPDDAFGNVDVHCHALPGMDDGPATLEDAVALLEMAAEDGTTHLVATPHANYQFLYVPERIAQERARLQTLIGDRLQILIGCDFHLSYENIQDALAHPRKYTVNGSRYLLVEFAQHFSMDALEGVLDQLLRAGLVPILTHPERNPVFQEHPDLAPRYIRLGCVTQVTASSFTGDFGKRAQKMAESMLAENLIHVVASDGHSASKRRPRLSGAAALIAERQNEERSIALIRDNPRAMILDLPLPYHPKPPKPKPKSAFWSLLKG
ncbi:MAG: tyrosine-protein phosphatase [Terriglobales bacterium]